MYVNAKGVALLDSGAATYTVATGAQNSTRIGTAKNDLFNSVGGDTLRGGLGDDTYTLWNANSTVVELAGEGNDTVVAKFWGAATLSDNVENLILSSPGSTAGTGNALDNVIVAGSIGATLDGLAGNDVLVGGAGADIFSIQKGNGSDAIYNFESGKDTIQLKNYGFTSFAQVMSAATQVGSDTSFALGNGETLVVRNIAKTGFVSADFGFKPLATVGLADSSVVGAAPTVTLSTAGRAQTYNGWTVFNNVYNPGTLKEGTDFSISSNYSRADMTAGTSFNWSFPYVTAATSTIRGFPEVVFGVAPLGNYAGNPTDTANTFPIALDKLQGLTATYDVSIGGTTSGFNIAYDIWLTNKPNGDKSTITNEVMIWVHKGEVQPYGTVIGTYSQGDATAKIYHTGTYTAVVFDNDKLAGTVDIAAVFHKLQDMGIITGQNYVASVELGAEIVSGVGSYTINNLDLTAKSIGDNGNLVTKEVTGSGTTVTETPSFVHDYTAGAVAEHDANGHQIGSAVTAIDTSGVTIKHVDLQSRTVSTDVLTGGSDGSVTTKHYDAASTLTGSDIAVKNSDGSQTVRHYSAAGALTGSDKLLTDTKGVSWDYHYNATGALTGTDKTIVSVATAAKTSTTIQHLDAAGKLTGWDGVIKTGNLTSAMHYDATGKMISADNSQLNADGSTTTLHYDGKWVATGSEIARTDATGVTTETQYNAQFVIKNTLYTGTVGSDTITGTAGTNTFHGGFGSDTLKLGSGADNVYFDTAIGTDVDRLVGFSAAKDTMYLDHNIFAGLKTGVLDASSFVAGTAAKDADDHLLYDKTTGKIWFDADGSGAQKAVLFAQIDPNTVLTNTDFVIF